MQGARRGWAARTRLSPGEGETITDDLPPIARAELALRGWLMRRRRPVVLALSVVLHGLIVLPIMFYHQLQLFVCSLLAARYAQR